MAYRYLLAWSYVTYHRLPPPAGRYLTRFLRTFQRVYPRQYDIAKQVIDIIEQHDIFTPEGHAEIMRKALALWRLDDQVALSTE